MEQKNIRLSDVVSLTQDMKQHRSIRKTVELGVLLSAVAVALTGCGGGSTGSTSNSTTTTPPVTTTASTNQIQLAISNGIYHLSGYSFILNGVPQVYISHANSDLSMTKMIGAVSSVETPTTLLDGLSAIGPYFPALTTAQSWSYPANSSQAISTNPGWTVTLNSQDISGQTVLSQIKKIDGSLLSPTLANASATFPAGSIAYTATYVASSNMVGGIGNIIGATSEAALLGNLQWCTGVNGLTNRLCARLEASNLVSLFSIPQSTCCGLTGLTAFTTGSWARTVSTSGDVFYKITYPASMSTSVWASNFTNAYSPSSKMSDLIIIPVGATQFYMGNDIPAGSSYTSLQPFFNYAALTALRTAAGI